MKSRRTLQCLLLLAALMVWIGSLAALAQEKKEGKKAEEPEGAINISELADKGLQPVHMVKPVYPPEAKKEGVTGEVNIDAIIGAKGEVKEAKALSGPEVLREAALQAVRQWRYKPLGVDAKVTIHVNFELAKKEKPEKPKS